MWPPLNIFTILMWLCCGVVPTERMLFCLILGKCRSDSTSPPLPQGVCDLFNDCTMLMWLYTAPTERMFSCLIWSLDNVDLTLPQGVCYIVWSLNNVDLTPSLPVHHLSHRKYVTTFDPWTKLIFIIAPTACMLYCSIPAQCRSYSTIFSSLKQGVCYIV